MKLAVYIATFILIALAVARIPDAFKQTEVSSQMKCKNWRKQGYPVKCEVKK